MSTGTQDAPGDEIRRQLRAAGWRVPDDDDELVRAEFRLMKSRSGSPGPSDSEEGIQDMVSEEIRRYRAERQLGRSA
ncbi:MAG: hypothetical protein ACTH2K_11065 [Candidatus Corynebacterium faecigallinarum]|uniref:hypothetical protein n=1 Tax=Corynebacterium TaxID=1716 RepID=UPI002591F1D3|nr:hypothetical protein [uncultured Corynebacterium sp.]